MLNKRTFSLSTKDTGKICHYKKSLQTLYKTTHLQTSITVQEINCLLNMATIHSNIHLIPSKMLVVLKCTVHLQQDLVSGKTTFHNLLSLFSIISKQMTRLHHNVQKISSLQVPNKTCTTDPKYMQSLINSLKAYWRSQAHTFWHLI